MAFAATTVWELRGGAGSDSNGGGFNSAATGTDYSQQNAAQVAYTDLVIDATTNTKITSAAHPFDATSPGNIINITGGSGFTVQRVQIVSVAAGVATCDKAVGTVGSTGGTGNLGGAMATFAAVIALVVDDNIVYVKKTATYTFTSSVTHSKNISVIGYDTDRNDYRASSITGRPLFTTATNSVTPFNIGFATSGMQIHNLELTCTAVTPATCFKNAGQSGYQLLMNRVKMNGWGAAWDSARTSGHLWIRCEVSSCVNDMIQFVNNASSGSVFESCYFHDNGGRVIYNNNGSVSLTFISCVFANNTGDCYYKPAGGISGNGAPTTFRDCVFYGNTANAINMAIATDNDDILHYQNCIFWDNGTYGVTITAPHTPAAVVGGSNAFGSQGTADRNNAPTLPGDFTISGDPFTDAAAGDFSLNSTAGAGAACKGVGIPSVIP